MAGDFGSWEGSARAEGEQFSLKERERVGGRLAQESAAGEDGVGEIDMAFVLGSTRGGVHSPGGSLGEIVNEETGKNLLKDKFRLLCMDMDQTYSVFQSAEGGLNTPAHGVELSQGGYRDLPGIQICDERLGSAAGGLQPDDSEG